MRAWRILTVSLIVCACGPLAGAAPEVEPLYKKVLTVRWEDAEQKNVFVVEGAHYQCRVSTLPARILSLKIDGKDLLGPDGALLACEDAQGVHYVPVPAEFVPKWNVWQGQGYAPARSSRARMNIWSASPYYWDAHLLDIPLLSANDVKEKPDAKPLRGELIFHAMADRLGIEIRASEFQGQAKPVRAVWTGLLGGTTKGQKGAESLLVLQSAGASCGVLGPPGASFDAQAGQALAPLTGEHNSTYWVIRPMGGSDAIESVFEPDLEPLPASVVAVENGAWLGYDPPSGLYRMQSHARLSAFQFEAAYKNPVRRIESDLLVKNDQTPRTILVKCATGVGNLEAAVLADLHGFPLPDPAFVCKNFAGEREEPDDAAFGDSYFPLRFAPGEHLRVKVLHPFQDWGLHPLKQVSS
ncbi:MAG TPA: hypothetical protein VGY53_13025, partial [Isosphaeraceae bacterium]|nr:hypothetical protein [Isosphaeraceae bacterium]